MLIWRLVSDATRHFLAHDGTALAGYIAFAMLLALFPFCIVAVMAASLVVGTDASLGAITRLVELLPPEFISTIEPVLLEVVGVNRGSVLTLSAAVALWSSSNGVEAFRTAFDRAYEVDDPRPWWLNRLQSLGLVVLGAITFILISLAIVVAPLGLSLAREYLQIETPGIVTLGRYVFGILIFLGFLYVMHRLLPSDRVTPVWPGILATTLLFFIGATGFSLYLAYAPGFAVTYGALAGVVVSMLFFYLSGAVIIFGAEVNASLIRLGRGTRRRKRRRRKAG